MEFGYGKYQKFYYPVQVVGKKMIFYDGLRRQVTKTIYFDNMLHGFMFEKLGHLNRI